MAAFQYEMGASKESIDPNSDWYAWTHDSFNILQGRVSGDLPENGPGYWDLFKIDHEWAKWLGLNAWRINPEWSRIFPRSTRDVKVDVSYDEDGNIIDISISEKKLEALDKIVNKRAVEHYLRIFNDIKDHGMKLIVNLYHWPLPLWIHDPIKVRDTFLQEGPRGWYDKDTVVEFAKFSAYISWKFKDLVDMWSTMNEPNVVWSQGYTSLIFPPGIISLGAMLRVAINLVEAHARAYDQIKRITNSKNVGVIYAVSPSYSLSESDKDAAKISDYRSTFWFFNAIVNGLLDLSFGGLFKGEKINRKDLKNKIDWVGINYYTRVVVKNFTKPFHYIVVPNYGYSCKPNSKSLDGLPTSDLGWELYPDGIKRAIKMISEYRRPIIIAENGVADAKDNLRPWQIISYLVKVNEAIKEGNELKGYLHWSLIDNLEWASGYSKKFGLIYVNLATKKRYPRPSAYLYRDIVKNNEIPEYLEEYSKYPSILI